MIRLLTRALFSSLSAIAVREILSAQLKRTNEPENETSLRTRERDRQRARDSEHTGNDARESLVRESSNRMSFVQSFPTRNARRREVRRRHRRANKDNQQVEREKKRERRGRRERNGIAHTRGSLASQKSARVRRSLSPSSIATHRPRAEPSLASPRLVSLTLLHTIVLSFET